MFCFSWSLSGEAVKTSGHVTHVATPLNSNFLTTTSFFPSYPSDTNQSWFLARWACRDKLNWMALSASSLLRVNPISSSSKIKFYLNRCHYESSRLSLRASATSSQKAKFVARRRESVSVRQLERPLSNVSRIISSSIYYWICGSGVWVLWLIFGCSWVYAVACKSVLCVGWWEDWESKWQHF